MRRIHHEDFTFHDHQRVSRRPVERDEHETQHELPVERHIVARGGWIGRAWCRWVDDMKARAAPRRVR
jgi:hypothetical protein